MNARQKRADDAKKLRAQKKLTKMFPDGDQPTAGFTKLFSNMEKLLPDEPKETNEDGIV